ncbi:MAG: hypothetical protein WD077_02030 [Bacteroidia bacterium]
MKTLITLCFAALIISLNLQPLHAQTNDAGVGSLVSLSPVFENMSLHVSNYGTNTLSGVTVNWIA